MHVESSLLNREVPINPPPFSPISVRRVVLVVLVVLVVRTQVMELKGQMIHLPESCSLMFLGSPRVDKLEELMGRGLHLSDIPIHDATRDVILVGEQTKAQDGLKKRMDKLKVRVRRSGAGGAQQGGHVGSWRAPWETLHPDGS